VVLAGACLSVLVFTSTSAAAQPLSLRAAIAQAARNNPTLAAALADVAIADADVVAARGLDDLTWDASAAWLRSRRATEALVPEASAQRPAGDSLLLSTALTQPLATGGLFALRLDTAIARSESASAPPAFEASSQTARSPSLQLSFAHPLLRGIGVDVARAARHRAQRRRDVAGLERDAAAAALTRDVVLAYWSCVLAGQELAIFRDATAAAREQLRAVQANIEVGKLPRSASAEVIVAVALREDEAIVAEEALQAGSIELGRVIGTPLDQGATLLPLAEEGEDLPALPAADAALELALARNPQLAAARAGTGAAGIEVDVASNGLLPTLDLALSAATSGSASATGTAFRQLAARDSYDVQARLVFATAINRHAAHGAMDRARGELHKAQLGQIEIERQIRAAVLLQLGAAAAAQRRLRALAEATEAASLDLAAERARFEVGRASNFDVLRRQDELAQAQLRRLHARIDHLRATAQLDAVTGTIVVRYQ
jgi:outer membrane protein